MTSFAGYAPATSSSASLRLAAASTVGAWACAPRAIAEKSNASSGRSMVTPIYSKKYIGSAKLPAQGTQVCSDGPKRRRLHAAVALEHFLAKRSKHRAAALGAALGGTHQGSAELTVHRVHQPPGAGIAHLHLAAGGGDRAGGGDTLQKLRFARAERDSLAQDYAQAEAGMPLDGGHPGIIRRRLGFQLAGGDGVFEIVRVEAVEALLAGLRLGIHQE